MQFLLCKLLLSTNATLVCVLSDAVILSFFVCLYVFRYMYLLDGDSNRRESLQGGIIRTQSLPFWRRYLQWSPNARPKKGEMVGFWASKKPFDREYLENGKSERYISIRASHQLNENFPRNVRESKESTISKNMLIF